MTTHSVHDRHEHVHGATCGHVAIQHGAHVDYLHDGHLHHAHGNHIDECVLAVDSAHPADCKTGHVCSGHAPNHVHGAGCGHEAVPHGDHVDYIVEDHLHHVHDGHCDDHGPVRFV